MNTQKITIGIIKLNDISINLTKTNIKEQIENIIEDDDNFDIHTVKTPQEVYEYIYPLLSPKKDKEILQYNFYENKDFFYSGFFVESNNTKNIFGSEIMSKNVTSNLYIVKHKLKYESNISFEYSLNNSSVAKGLASISNIHLNRLSLSYIGASSGAIILPSQGILSSILILSNTLRPASKKITLFHRLNQSSNT
jgi:hypothetical protein